MRLGRCDRCGSTADLYKTVHIGEAPGPVRLEPWFWSVLGRDLCYECYTEFTAWLEKEA
jgi:hypothetical protein